MSKLKNIFLAISLFLMPTVVFSQAFIPLGELSSFGAYSGIGAISNLGTFTGDVGTNLGVISGFDTNPSFSGSTFYANAKTLQAKEDMLWTYIHLNNLPVTHYNHAPAFGSGETLSPGVYEIPSAGSLAGNITLSGGVDDFFIFKFEGPLTMGAGSNVILSGGLRPANVFWISNGAVLVTPTSVANVSEIKGSLFSYIGAITLGGNCKLDGRMLSVEGAISTGIGSLVLKPLDLCTIPMKNYGVTEPVHDVLGSLGDFLFFTKNGAVSNASTSAIVGNVGANAGSISGFGTSTHVGSLQLGPANVITNQAALDLDDAYTQLMDIPATVTPAHGASFGTAALPGEVLNPGVYDIASAATLGGFLTLDGGGDNKAVFIFRIAGAFSVASRAKVILTNGTEACNVFWITTGASAISMGTWSYMKGTLIAGGAISMGASGNLDGRMFSRAGAVSFSTGIAYNGQFPSLVPPSSLPIDLLSFNAVSENLHVNVNWVTASEVNNDYFTIERSADGQSWEAVQRVNGSGNSTNELNYSWLDTSPHSGVSYYRLKQTDYNGKSETFDAVSVVQSEVKELQAYPNPVSQVTSLLGVDADQPLLVYNTTGVEVTGNVIFSSSTSQKFFLDMSQLPRGLYFVVNGNKSIRLMKN